MKANSKTSPKVFKLKTLTLPAKGDATITKSHHVKPITTRTYYPGSHLLEIQVNGKVLHRAKWTLQIK